jgi:hypothetical protein
MVQHHGAAHSGGAHSPLEIAVLNLSVLFQRLMNEGHGRGAFSTFGQFGASFGG